MKQCNIVDMARLQPSGERDKSRIFVLGQSGVSTCLHHYFDSEVDWNHSLFKYLKLMLIRNQVKIPYASLLSLLPTHLSVGDSGWLVGLVHRDTCVIPSALSSSMKCSMISFPLAMLSPYCFIASFSMLLSKPKKNLMSTLAFCSKHVQSEFSGWTWKPIINFSNFTLKICYMA